MTLKHCIIYITTIEGCKSHGNVASPAFKSNPTNFEEKKQFFKDFVYYNFSISLCFNFTTN